MLNVKWNKAGKRYVYRVSVMREKEREREREREKKEKENEKRRRRGKKKSVKQKLIKSIFCE
jgi:hypothetical protein